MMGEEETNNGGKEEIITRYKALHDELSTAYYDGSSGLPKGEFDDQHGEIWIDMKQELIDEGFLLAIYQYEAFSKEIIHPKKDTPLYVGYEVLEFSQELTQQDIEDLETQLGKIVRRLGDPDEREVNGNS